jgi:hypothetical protein
MNIDEVVQHQIDAAIAGLTRARDKIAGMKPDDTHEIGRQIDSAASYLEDIQYNWSSLVRSHAAQRTPSSTNREIL